MRLWPKKKLASEIERDEQEFIRRRQLTENTLMSDRNIREEIAAEKVAVLETAKEMARKPRVNAKTLLSCALNKEIAYAILEIRERFRFWVAVVSASVFLITATLAIFMRFGLLGVAYGLAAAAIAFLVALPIFKWREKKALRKLMADSDQDIQSITRDGFAITKF